MPILETVGSSEHHRLLDQVLATLSDRLYIFDREHRFLYASPAGLAALGLEASAILGQTWEQLSVATPEFQVQAEGINVVFATGTTVRGVTNPTAVSGQRNYEYVLSPLLDSNGTVEGVISRLRDVTVVEPSIERLLQDSQARFAAAFQSNPNAMLISRLRDGLILDVNDQFTQMVGYTKAAAIGQTTLSLQLWADPEQRTYVVNYLANHPTLHNYEVACRHQSGAILTGLFSCQVLELDGETCLLSVMRDITQAKQEQAERQLIEQELQASYDRYNTLMRNLGEGIWLYDLIANQVTASQQYWHLLGETERDTTSIVPIAEFADRVHPDDMPRLLTAVELHLQQHQRFNIEFRLRHQQGHHIWVRSRGQAIHDASGQPMQIIGTIEDISDRKRAEIALQESETRYRTLMEISPVGIFRFDQPFNCVYVNDRWSEMTGRSKESALGRGWIAALHPDEREERLATWTTVYQSSDAHATLECGQGRHLRPDGSINWYYVQVAPELDTTGSVTGYVGTLTDITAFKQLEFRLQEVQTNLNAVLDTTLVGIIKFRFYSQQRFDYEYISPHCATIFGYTVEEWRANPHLWDSCVHPDDWQTILEPTLEKVLALRGTASYSMEYRFYRKDSSLCWILERLRVEWCEPEQFWMITSVMMDISDRKRAEIALQESEARYRTLMEISPVGIFRMDDPLNCVYVNDRWSEMTGRSKESALGRGWTAALHPDEREQLLAQWADNHTRTSLEQHLLPGGEGRHLCPDGSITWYYAQVACEFDAAGEICGYIGALTDITDLKQLELALQASQAQLSTVLDKAIAGIIKLRFYPDGKYVYDYISPHCELIYDYTREELLANQQLWESRIHPDDERDVFQPLMQAVLNQTGTATYSIEYRFYRRDDSIGWVLANLWVEWQPNNGYWEITIVDTEISDRKQAELALQEREARFRELSETSPANIYILVLRVDGSIYFEHISRAIEAIHGIPAEQFIDNPALIHECIHPDDRSSYTAAVNRSLEALELFDHEWRIVTASGDVKWIHGISCPKRRDNGETAWYGTVIDITDRKSAELALRLSETKFQELAAASPGIIHTLVFDPNGKQHFEYISPAVTDIYELSPAEILQDADLPCNLMHPDDRSGHTTAVLQSVSTGTPFQHEWRIITPSGKLKWLSGHGRYQPRETGEQVWYGIVLDITDRKQIELQLQDLNQSLERKVEERTAALQASATQIQRQAQQETLLREMTQRIRQSLDLQTIFDTACQEMLHWSQAERVMIVQSATPNQPDHGVLVAEAAVPPLPTLRALSTETQTDPSTLAAAPGSYCTGTTESDSKIDSSQQFPIPIHLRMPSTEANELWGVLCIQKGETAAPWTAEDIAFAQEIANQLAIAIQQASLFEQLAERNQELARATRLKDEFLANMSHELRTPLNAVLGMAETLEEELFGPLNPKQSQAVQTIQQTGSHLLALINDILDLAKVEAGQVELRLTPTALIPLCQSSLEFIKPQALKKQLQLQVNLPSYLPEAMVDERRLRQVLVNLLNNAVKFTPNGGQITVSLSLVNLSDSQAGHESWFRLAVADTGIGIAAEDIAKLFQPFVQIDTALNRQYQGTGLGLALVRRLVELHGGQVSLTSEVGRGSCFIVDLPYVLPPNSPASSLPKADTLELSHPFCNTAPLILLVEDNEDNIVTVGSYLEVKGDRLLVARNGQEAIALTASVHPDLILMDIQMPGMNGLEAIQRIRCLPNGKHIPIIALTALVMEGDRDRCLAAGATEYLAKPVKLKQLHALIAQLLMPPNP